MQKRLFTLNSATPKVVAFTLIELLKRKLAYQSKDSNLRRFTLIELLVGRRPTLRRFTAFTYVAKQAVYGIFCVLLLVVCGDVDVWSWSGSVA